MDLVLPEDQRTLELTGTVWNDDQTSSALQKNISRMTVFFFSCAGGETFGPCRLISGNR